MRRVGPILPGATIGILGSGQLGRMLAMTAKRMGYRAVVFSPEPDSPAGQVADAEIVAAYEDEDALAAFAGGVDVVTFEFENIPTRSVEVLDALVPVFPKAQVLHTTQNRLREKWFLSLQGFPVTPFAPVNSWEELQQAISTLGLPAVLKTAGFGYDGKGQTLIREPGDADAAFESLQGQPAILEQFVMLEKELSVIVAHNGEEVAAYAPVQNTHVRHILDTTVAPADISKELAAQAVEMARRIANTLKLRGVLCVEFFLTADGSLLVNELAPRPHNSGHYTIEACPCSQFEQQLRAVCGLPLGSTQQLIPAAMANLLGDEWNDGEPYWAELLRQPLIYLHLYGKAEPRPGRKMGHITALGATAEEAMERIRRARLALHNPVQTPS